MTLSSLDIFLIPRFEIEDFQKAYGSKGRGYTYSKMLNKLFIEMGKPVAVRFFVTGAKDSDQIRALPVYTSISARSEPVVRCPIHAQPSDQSNTGVEVEMCQHLVRCQETGPGGARYQEDSTTGRLSVVTRVKETAPGCDYFTVIYQFMCLGSCPGGLARRPINVIWSLETGSGEVVGRQSLEVRICTCPFRDQQQEETRAQRCSIQASLVQSKILNKHTPKKPADDDDNTSDTKNDGQLYYVPVRGLENFHKVNKFAEYLDLTDGGELMTEEAVLRRKTRTSLVLESNPGLSEQMLSESSGAKKRKLMQIQSQCEPSTTILKQSVPYRILRQAPLSQQTGTTRIIRPSSASSLHIPVQVLRPTSPRSSLKSNLSTPATKILALPRLPVSKYNVSGPNSSTTMVLPPRPPLGKYEEQE